MAVVIPIVSEWNPKGVNKSLADIKSAEGAWGKAGAGIKAAALPAAAALGGLAVAGYDFAKSAMEDQKSAVQLANALKKTTGATDDQVASVEDWITKQSLASGIADDKIRPGLMRLANSYGSIEEAQKMQTLAMEIATAKGKDAGDVAVALARANDGQIGALKKLGITLGPAASAMNDLNIENKKLTKLQADAANALALFGPKSEEYAKALGKVNEQQAITAKLATSGTDWASELSNQFGGSMSANAETAAGKMERMNVAINEAKESIGYALLPVIEKLLAPLQGLAEWLGKNTQLIVIIGGVIGGLAATILVVNGVMAAWGAITKIVTIAQAALNLALSLNPIGLVVIAIAALVAGLVIAYNKSETFRNIVDAVWTALKNSTVAVFGAIKNVILTVWDWMKTLFSVTPVGVLITHWELFRDTTVAIWDAVYGAIETVVNKIKAIIDAVIGKITEAIKKAKDFASSIPFIGGLFGGDGPQLSSSSTYLLNASSSPAVGAASPAVSITVNAGVGDPVQIARAIENTLRTRNIRLGLA